MPRRKVDHITAITEHRHRRRGENIGPRPAAKFGRLRRLRVRGPDRGPELTHRVTSVVDHDHAICGPGQFSDGMAQARTIDEDAAPDLPSRRLARRRQDPLMVPHKN
eukprot:1222127-Pyramimonas_sp.AAC.1